jgi:hypothetical protein
MGWSSWSFLRQNPTAATVEAQAKAMASSGLAGAGLQYVNPDDFYYTHPADNPRTNDPGLHLRRRAGGDHPALRQHGDRVREPVGLLQMLGR